MVPYKNDTPCEKMSKSDLPRAGLSCFSEGILDFVVSFRPMVMGF